MIEVVIFTGVFLLFYGIEFCIEYFIFGNAKGKHVSSIQTEQRKLLEAHAILKEVTLEAVSPSIQHEHNTTATQYIQNEINNTVSCNTSLVVYHPAVEGTSSYTLVCLGSVVSLLVLVFLISKWFDKTERKQNETSSSDTYIKEDDNTRTLKECVEEYAESSDEWFDACELCSSVLEDDVFEEWFDGCTECISATEGDYVYEEWFDAECSSVTEDDVSEEWFDACEECYYNVDDRESGVFMVSDEVSSADESEGVLIAFADFSLQQTKEFMETTGFVLTLPEKDSDNRSSRLGNRSMKDKKHLVRDEESRLAFTLNVEDTRDQTVLVEHISLEETEILKDTKTVETTMSNQLEENVKTEKEVEETRNETEKQDKEVGINTFKTDVQISQSTNMASLERELQRWESVENDEVAELEYLEKEGEDLKDETILSPEKMYELNPDVNSTFLDDLSQYTTKLDMSTLSREQIEFAEKMANEIMKENKQKKNKQRRKNSKRRNRNY